MIITVGTGSWVHSLVHADGGFDVPEINDDFNQFEQKTPVQQEQPVHSPPVEEEKGFWDFVTEPISEAWEWTTDKVSGAWEWTKEKAAAFWDWFTEICSKIAEVVIDALSAAWDWILEHKVAVLIVLTIIGIVASVIGIILGSTLAGFIGAGIIFGELINGIVSWVFLGNEFFSDEMLTDMLIGGIAGLISSLFGLIAGAGVANSSFVSWLSTRIPWLGRAFPKMFGGGIASGVDQSLWDLLKEGKVNWKKAAVATGLGFLLVFGGEAIHSNSNKIINWINNRNISYATEIFADGTASAPKTVGDTKFGQWLQKFATDDIDGVTRLKARGKKYQTDEGAIIQGKQIVKVNPVPKYQPIKNELNLDYVSKVRKKLGIPPVGDDLRLVNEGVLRSEQTVAVLQSDGVEIWGRNAWGPDVKNGYKEMRDEWFTKRSPGNFGTNANTRYHAEGDAFWHLYKYRKEHKILGGKAVMAVDRKLCRYCDQSKGVQQMVEEVGLDELKVITPDGVRIIKPDPARRRASWDDIR
jgi:hypothetical protein